MAKISSKTQKSKTGEIITVRIATTQDAEKIHSLGMEVFLSSDYLVATPEEFSAIPLDRQIERIKNHEANESGVWLVAECGGELVGMIDFQGAKSKKHRHKGAFGMVVRPSWQNKGVGSALLSTLIEWVRAHPYLEVINLTVSEENAGAVALYKKLGFQITGREPYGLKHPDGRFLVDLTMTLKL
jgi:RimJ/RimL family protein N-acetyltransferase